MEEKRLYGVYYQKNNDDELMHYGVLGMKWGVRRYQNKDGSLTPAGKKKVSNDSKMYKHKYEKASNAIKDYYDDLHKQNSYINPSTGNRIVIYNYKKREKAQAYMDDLNIFGKKLKDFYGDGFHEEGSIINGKLYVRAKLNDIIIVDTED